MNRFIIGALVGAIIIFVWQFLSFAALNIHGPNQQYTSNQTDILTFLDGKLAEGHYFLPTTAPGASEEEVNSLMTNAEGKPWAQISYHDAFEMNMGMNLARGFASDLIALFLLCWLLLKIDPLDMKTAILACLAVGLINYLVTTYSYQVWYHTNSIPDLIDTIVQYALVGAWLGFYFGNKR